VGENEHIIQKWVKKGDGRMRKVFIVFLALLIPVIFSGITLKEYISLKVALDGKEFIYVPSIRYVTYNYNGTICFVGMALTKEIIMVSVHQKNSDSEEKTRNTQRWFLEKLGFTNEIINKILSNHRDLFEYDSKIYAFEHMIENNNHIIQFVRYSFLEGDEQ